MQKIAGLHSIQAIFLLRKLVQDVSLKIMPDKFTDKIVLITGAGRGIGKACVQAFLREGAMVLGCSLSQKNLDSLSEELAQYQDKLYLLAVDLSKSTEIDRLFEFVNSHTDHLDSVVNAAGVHIASLIADLNEADYDQVLNVNLKAPVLICRNAVPYLDKSASATIVNVSSLSGCFGVQKFPAFGSYDISKYGLWGLTEILAIELREKNIRVNQVSPSGVDTEMFYKAVPPGVEPLLSPQQVARTIMYLAGEDSAPLSGENIRLFG